MGESTSNKCYAVLLYDELWEYEEEIAELSKVVADDPTNVYAWHNRGLANWEIGNAVAARRDLTKAASLNHREYLPHYVLGEFLDSIGETDAAAAAYEAGLAVLPENPDLNLKLAQLFAEQHEYALALKHIDVAIANGSGYIYIHDERQQILKALNMTS